MLILQYLLQCLYFLNQMVLVATPLIITETFYPLLNAGSSVFKSAFSLLTETPSAHNEPAAATFNASSSSTVIDDPLVNLYLDHIFASYSDQFSSYLHPSIEALINETLTKSLVGTSNTDLSAFEAFDVNSIIMPDPQRLIPLCMYDTMYDCQVITAVPEIDAIFCTSTGTDCSGERTPNVLEDSVLLARPSANISDRDSSQDSLEERASIGLNVKSLVLILLGMAAYFLIVSILSYTIVSSYTNHNTRSYILL